MKSLLSAHDIQVLDFLCGNVLVFFVIKIQKIRTQGGDVSDSCAAIPVAVTSLFRPLGPDLNLSPDLAERTALQFAQEDFKPMVDCSSGGLNSEIGGCPGLDCSTTASFLAKMLTLLPGSGVRVESDVTYRKHRGAYQSTRGQNSPLATSKLRHIFASNKVKNRASRASQFDRIGQWNHRPY